MLSSPATAKMSSQVAGNLPPADTKLTIPGCLEKLVDPESQVGFINS